MMSGYDQEADYDAFLKHLPELVADHRGKVAILHDAEVVKVVGSLEKAIQYGAKAYGMERFIVQEIIDDDPQILSYTMLI